LWLGGKSLNTASTFGALARVPLGHAQIIRQALPSALCPLPFVLLDSLYVTH
jgi:hypothetical protein